MNLLRSEWLKLFTTRTTWAMLGIGLLCEALFAGLVTGLVSFDDLGDVDEIATGMGILMTLMLVLGVLVITTEFRHGTASSTFLVSPRRWPVLLAKLGACLLVGLLAGLLYVAVNGGLALPIYSSRGGDLGSTQRLVEIYAGVVVSSLPELLPGSIGEYVPAQAVGTLHGRVEGDGALTQLSAGLVLAAWAGALVAVGTATILRRDLSE